MTVLRWKAEMFTIEFSGITRIHLRLGSKVLSAGYIGGKLKVHVMGLVNEQRQSYEEYEFFATGKNAEVPADLNTYTFLQTIDFYSTVRGVEVYLPNHVFYRKFNG